MELKRISNNKTQLKIGIKQNKEFIEQLKFIGAVPTRESRKYVYFEFNGDMNKTKEMLGIW